MKTKLTLALFILHFSLFTFHFSTAQVLCIKCYNQNARVLSDTANLILNGGFENGCPATLHYNDTSFCPNSQWYHCDITNWTCTAGGYYTYAHIVDSSFSTVPEGIKAAYFGNGANCYLCSNSDTLCLGNIGCETTGLSNGYPTTQFDYGGTNGVSLEQTVSGLIVGRIYELEFWAGGEPYDSLVFASKGLFALDIGFGNIFLRDPPTMPHGGNFGIGIRYIVVFVASATSHTIKFTNWGHAFYPHLTELILDDVRMFAANPDENICATNINEPTKNEVSVSPNPFSSSFIIKTGGQLGNARINVYNVLGELVTSWQLAIGSWQIGGCQLPTSSPAGIYFLEVVTDQGAQVVRLVKM